MAVRAASVAGQAAISRATIRSAAGELAQRPARLSAGLLGNGRCAVAAGEHERVNGSVARRYVEAAQRPGGVATARVGAQSDGRAWSEHRLRESHGLDRGDGLNLDLLAERPAVRARRFDREVDVGVLPLELGDRPFDGDFFGRVESRGAVVGGGCA